MLSVVMVITIITVTITVTSYCYYVRLTMRREFAVHGLRREVLQELSQMLRALCASISEDEAT